MWSGDVNRDEFADFFIGSPQMGTTNPNGVAYLLLGSADIASNPGLTLSSLTNIFTIASTLSFEAAGTGTSISFVGDVNNDTYIDLIVGAPLTLTLTSSGATFVIFGTASGFSGVNLNDFGVPGVCLRVLLICDFV